MNHEVSFKKPKITASSVKKKLKKSLFGFLLMVE